MYKFDSEAMIKGLEELYGAEDLPLDYEEYENYIETYEQITERELKGDM